ncbi:MAG TPA: LCP family protein [Candidatus Saccharimonadales bacterium]|nr:LCP family protein [Candidatus Saccharimonadales bacterium]
MDDYDRINRREKPLAVPQRYLDIIPKKTDVQPEPSLLVNPTPVESTPGNLPATPINTAWNDIKQSLQSIDNEPNVQRKPRRHTKRRVVKPHRAKTKRRWIKRAIITILIIGFGIVGFLAVKAFLISSGIFNGGNLFSLLAPGTPLQTDSQGRTNIVVFGTSQDDSAHQNASGGGGLWLTDSIELISINQKAKTIKMVGIPRDLWVALNNCSVGDYAKINAVYECGANLFNSSGNPGSNYAKQDATGAQQLMNMIQTVTGITPQYYVHADYTVLKQAVDAVGGVNVNIVGDGASGIYDTNFDWDCPNGAYTCKNVYYPHNGVYHLDGTQALFLARARADSGAYSYEDFGLDQGDFDRQANQQKILIALEAKVQTAGVLANPVALNNLLDAFGNNISMNFSGGEIKTLLSFAKSLSSKSITQVSLVKTGNEVVTDSEVDGQSVVVPTSGTYDFSSIIDYLTKELSNNPAVNEGATIAVYNASYTTGAASAEQAKLQQIGLTVDTIGDANNRDAGAGSYSLYDQSQGKKPKTLAFLQTELGVKATTSPTPSDINSNDDFVIIVNQ